MPNSKIFDKNVPNSTEILQKKTVAIAGCGGLGSNAAVALARAGIGKLKLADFDIIEESNLNRQYFFQSDIGNKKVDTLSFHLKNINPQLQIVIYDQKLNEQNISNFFEDADLLIEAFDKAEEKKWLIESWCKTKADKKIICASGLSGLGKTDDLKIQKSGNIIFCGDGQTDRSMGLCSARVAIVSNMQANIAIEVLVNDHGK